MDGWLVVELVAVENDDVHLPIRDYQMVNPGVKHEFPLFSFNTRRVSMAGVHQCPINLLAIFIFSEPAKKIDGFQCERKKRRERKDSDE